MKKNKKNKKNQKKQKPAPVWALDPKSLSHGDHMAGDGCHYDGGDYWTCGTKANEKERELASHGEAVARLEVTTANKPLAESAFMDDAAHQYLKNVDVLRFVSQLDNARGKPFVFYPSNEDILGLTANFMLVTGCYEREGVIQIIEKVLQRANKHTTTPTTDDLIKEIRDAVRFSRGPIGADGASLMDFARFGDQR